MPVQVNELVIKAVVTEEGGRAPQGGPPLDTAEVVALCVEQVLEILREKGER